LSGLRHAPPAGIRDGARRPIFAEKGEPGIIPIENCAGATIYPGMTAPRRPAAKDPWLDKLNRLLAHTADLGPAQWVARAQGRLRLITTRPHGQVVAAALNRDEKVLAHLGTWRGTPELVVEVAQTDFAPGAPCITVRNGTVCIACEDAPAAAPPADFVAWFKRLFGRDLPVAGWGDSLYPAGPHIWLPAGVSKEELGGFPHPLRLRGRTEYRLAAFDGHGCNSYAFYLSEVRAGLNLRLRLAFGGVYGDPERDSAAVVEVVKQLYELVDEVRDRVTHFEYVSDMGRDHARLRGQAGEWQGMVRGVDELVDLARTIAKGDMPERSSDSGRPPPRWAT
jgi:hypothetical protein